MGSDPTNTPVPLPLTADFPQNTTEDIAQCFVFDYYIAILMAVCAASCFLGNTLSLLTFSRQTSLTGTSPTMFLLQAMALADILVLIPVVFVTIYPNICVASSQLGEVCEHYVQRWLSYAISFLWPFSPIGQIASAWLTVTVTFHRYRAVCRPLACRSCNPMKRVYVQVALVWLFSCLYNIPRFFEFRVESISSIDNQTFNVYHKTDMYYNRVYQIVYRNVLYLVLMNIIPVTLLLVLTSRLVKTLKKAEEIQDQIRAAPQLRITSRRQRRERSLTFTLVVVVVIFILCQTPTVINRMLSLIYSDVSCGTWVFYFTQIANLMIIFNSSINFYVYTSCSTTFRYHLRRMFMCCGRPCRGCCVKKTSHRHKGTLRLRYITGISNYGFENDPSKDQPPPLVALIHQKVLIDMSESALELGTSVIDSDKDTTTNNSVSLTTVCTQL